MTAVQAFLDAAAAERPTPDDLCYVNDFADPYQPRALRLPAGRGVALRERMDAVLARLTREVPVAYESPEYGAARQQLADRLSEERGALLEGLEAKAKDAGHAIKLTPMGMLLVPRLGERELTESELGALPEAVRVDFEAKGKGLRKEIGTTLERIRAVERAIEEGRAELDAEVARFVVGDALRDVQAEFASFPEVAVYLEQVAEALREDVDAFRRHEPGEVDPVERDRPFQVNVLVPHAADAGAPVVVEHNPTYSNLFGRIEREARGEQLVLSTDFGLIRPGSLHRAQGGFVVLPVEDLLREPFSWDALKRALRSGQLSIEEPAERLGISTHKTLQPRPVPLQLKVILVGSPVLYYLLHRLDSEFPELFKVKADFDRRMAATPETARAFLRVLRKLSDEEGLLPLDAAACARLLEHSERLAGERGTLSACFGPLCDVAREATFWAREEGLAHVGAAQLERALEQQVYRSNLIEERIREAVTAGTIRLQLGGTAIGQLNGLSVADLGSYSFGRPARISASVGVGGRGVLDIERQAELGGRLHSKGVMILSGYLLRTYARVRPLALTASLAFEQSYDEIDGDSASSAELYVLLSALGEVPLRQGMAVTGSVDQEGRVQAVGGLNEKIEGFFATCQAAGLTGEQGVVVPRANVRHLQLSRAVVDAVAAGRFRVWAVSTIDEGLELLSGLPAGARDLDGSYPAHSIHGRVAARLEAFHRALEAPSEPEEDALVLPRPRLNAAQETP